MKIDGHVFEVEIEDLNASPIITRVNGEVIHVWIENNSGGNQAVPTKDAAVQAVDVRRGVPSPAPSSDGCQVLAPIPGTIVSIAIHPGANVAAGDELCVLEAMKMKNIIRSPRAGVIASIHVSSGQIVQHHDLLMEFSE
ncbi:MAG: acetyl-CoA carboxylase biotin carboxyl carrier protein subunit [Chloroflexi bacterium]|nr:acetyl-CoA carboxylase biotin carboxyl carrier protein subunit [Chloroflexota bacterium]